MLYCMTNHISGNGLNQSCIEHSIIMNESNEKIAPCNCECLRLYTLKLCMFHGREHLCLSFGSVDGLHTGIFCGVEVRYLER